MSAQRLTEARAAAEAAIEAFGQNAFLARIDAGSLTRGHLHALLRALHPQVRSSSEGLAVASAHCDPARLPAIRAYLLQHARDERGHEGWIEADLASQGAEVAGLARARIGEATRAYVEMNAFASVHCPPARLGSCAFLEGASARLGPRYGRRMLQVLALRPEQMTFFQSHATLDAGHVEEIWAVLGTAQLVEAEWDGLIETIQRAGRLYTRIYDEAAR